ncbi:MAG: DUF3833 family protein, partial [Bdellovibrionales bacterium]|nr:DUF3833 family protein [Bdellovibrionales bacterium]
MKLFIILFSLVLSSCASYNVEVYKKEKPKFELESFFNGKIRALGIVQNRSRQVIKRFDVDIVASWDGPVGTLKENFLYSDGTKSQRVWTINKLSPSNFSGRASDVEGVAKGKTSGNAFY